MTSFLGISFAGFVTPFFAGKFITAWLFGNSNPFEEKQQMRICFAGRKRMAGSVCITYILHLMSMSSLYRSILLNRESYLPGPFGPENHLSDAHSSPHT